MAHIDEVCMAFYIFNQKMVDALTRHRLYSKEQNVATEEVREWLRAELGKLGLAQHIDWTVAR